MWWVRIKDEKATTGHDVSCIAGSLEKGFCDSYAPLEYLDSTGVCAGLGVSFT